MAGARALLRVRAAYAVAWSTVIVSCIAMMGAFFIGRRISFVLTYLAALGSAALRAVAVASTLATPPPQPRSRIGRTLSIIRPRQLALAALLAVSSLLASLVWLPRSGNQGLSETTFALLLFAVVDGIWNGIGLGLNPPRPHSPLLNQSMFVRTKIAWYESFKTAFKSTPRPALLFLIVYWWQSDFVLDILRLKLSDPPLSLLSPTLLFPCLIHCFLFRLSNDCINNLFRIFLTDRIIFPIEKTPEYPGLYEELTGDIELLNRSAAVDLLHLSMNDQNRRQEIFSLSRPGGHPTNWNNLHKACLQVINAHTQEIDSIAGDKPQPKPTVLEPQHIPIRNTLRNLSSPYVIEKLPGKTINESIKQSYDTIITNIRNCQFISYFFGEIAELKVENVAHKSQIVSKVAQGLSILCEVSLNEDTYGVVQNDLPDVLTALIELKLSIDRLTKMNVINRRNIKRDVAVTQMLNDIKSSVKRSIYRITVAFKNYMKDIPLGAEARTALLPFLHMCES